MAEAADLLGQIRAINETAQFNRWCGLEVISAAPGAVDIAMPWRTEAGQYSGFLHAGVVAALIDTACGYAAVTLVGRAGTFDLIRDGRPSDRPAIRDLTLAEIPALMQSLLP